VAQRRDEELILLFYGEHAAAAEIERDLAADPELSRRYEALRRELLALDRVDAAEPRPGLEARIWARIAPALERRPRRFRVPSAWLGWGVLTTAVLATALVGFFAGRTLRPSPTEQQAVATLKALPPEARDRVLQAALAEHLDSSERLLLEVVNGAPTADEERRWATALLSANRLYRRAAERAGQRRVAAVLAELEPLLMQIVDAPEASGSRLSQQRIENADLLFKVRITRNNLKELAL